MTTSIPSEDAARGGVSRRSLFKRGSALALTASIPGLLAACGEDDDSSSGGGSGPAVKIGFIALTDCASIVMADALGYFEERGVNVEIVKQASWPATRDALLNGDIDAAHCLFGMPFSVATGVGGKAGTNGLKVAMTLNNNGQAITLNRTRGARSGRRAPRRCAARTRRGARQATWGRPGRAPSRRYGPGHGASMWIVAKPVSTYGPTRIRSRMSTFAAIALLVLGLAAVAGTLNARRPARTWWLVMPSWILAWVTVELAAHLLALSALAALGLVALGALDHAIGWVGLGFVAAAGAYALPAILRARRTRIDFGDGARELDPDVEATRYPRSHVALPLLALRRRGVRFERAVHYGMRDDVRPLKLDVYLPAEPAQAPRPAIVQVHGGGWVFGTRKEQGIPLLTHLAANGWVGFNIDYRLSPWATFPDHVVDVKRAIAWVREHAAEYGVDPSFIALTGGSAGGHLSALAALTPGDPAFQPGFEQADTSVAAAVPFYGVYDFIDEDAIQLPLLSDRVLEPLVFKARRTQARERFEAASPIQRVHADAPPMLVVHGDRDSLVPVEGARRFVERLRDVSRNPVLYAEMQGAQHAFDLVASWRTVPVIEAIERFLVTVHRRREQPADAVERGLEESLT